MICYLCSDNQNKQEVYDSWKSLLDDCLYAVDIAKNIRKMQSVDIDFERLFKLENRLLRLLEIMEGSKKPCQ